MKLRLSVMIGIIVLVRLASSQSGQPRRFPLDKAVGVNPDTHLILTFNSPPKLGTAGQIRIFDASNDRLVDKNTARGHLTVRP